MSCVSVIFEASLAAASGPQTFELHHSDDLPPWRAALFAFRQHPVVARQRVLEALGEHIDHIPQLLQRGFGKMSSSQIHANRLRVVDKIDEEHVTESIKDNRQERKRKWLQTYRSGIKRAKEATQKAFRAAAPCIL